MNYNTYYDISCLKEWCSENGVTEKNQLEPLLMRYYRLNSSEELHEKYSAEVINFVGEWLNSDNDDFLIQKMDESFSKLSPEMRYIVLDEYLEDISSYADLAKSFPDIEILMEKNAALEEDGYYDEYRSYYDEPVSLISQIPIDRIVKCVNEKGKKADIVLQSIAQAYIRKEVDSLERMNSVFSLINSDCARAKLTILSKNYDYLQSIQDLFCRGQILKQLSECIFYKNELLDEINQYEEHLKALSSRPDESDKAEYIASIDNEHMKVAMLLSFVKDRKNKQKIIDSFQGKVNENIKPVDDLVRKMIVEFYEDVLGDDFSDDKKERLAICFARTNVDYGNPEFAEINGDKYLCPAIYGVGPYNLSISALLYEYERIFSNFDVFLYTSVAQHVILERGMGVAFANLVLKHYVDKHNGEELLIGGNKVNYEDLFQSYSLYSDLDAYAKTMLYGLVLSGKDIQAVGEYTLGSKNTFANMVFGEEGAKSKISKNQVGIEIFTNMSELYKSPTLDFSDIDEHSVYYHSNYLLSLFKLQNKLKNKMDILDKEEYNFKEIAKLYFDGKEFYEVSKEDLAKFFKLVEPISEENKKRRGYIYTSTTYEELDSFFTTISEYDLDEHSFEILERIPIIYGKRSSPGTTLENIIDELIKSEIQKMVYWDSADISEKKVNAIRAAYSERFDKHDKSNRWIYDHLSPYYITYNYLKRTNTESGKAHNGEKKIITPDDIYSRIYESERRRRKRRSEKRRRKKEREKESKNEENGEALGDGPFLT